MSSIERKLKRKELPPEGTPRLPIRIYSASPADSHSRTYELEKKKKNQNLNHHRLFNCLGYLFLPFLGLGFPFRFTLSFSADIINLLRLRNGIQSRHQGLFLYNNSILPFLPFSFPLIIVILPYTTLQQVLDF